MLTRPVGRPSNAPVVWYAGFLYQTKSWDRARRVVAKVEWHSGELFPRVGFIVTNLTRPAKRVVRFYNQRGTAEQWIKEGKNAVKWTRLSRFCGQPGAAATVRAGLQFGQFPAAGGAAPSSASLDIDDAAGETDQDRGEGRAPLPENCLSDGRSGGAPRAVPDNFGTDWTTEIGNCDVRMKADHGKTTAITEVVSSLPGETRHWSQKCRRNTTCAGKKQVADWKK